MGLSQVEKKEVGDAYMSGICTCLNGATDYRRRRVNVVYKYCFSV